MTPWRTPVGAFWRTLAFVGLLALVAMGCSSAAGPVGEDAAVPETVEKTTTTTDSPEIAGASDDPLADVDELGGAEGIFTGGETTDDFELPPKVVPPPTAAPTTLPPPAPATTVAPIEVADANTVYYVDAQNGDDGADGSSVEQAWRSLGRGIDALQPGTTVFVLDGVYDELRSPNQAHYVIRDRRGSNDAWSRLLAYPGHRPKIVATSTSGVEILFSDFVEVSGFEIEGVGFGPDNTQGYGIIARDGHHFLFQDNVIYGMGNSGIGGGMNSSHFNIVNNTIHDNGLWSPDGSSGVSLWRLNNVGGGDESDGYSNRIVGNRLYRNENRVPCSCVPDRVAITDGNGIIIDQSTLAGYNGRTLIANNTIFNNGAKAVNVFHSARVDIFNNSTYQNSFTAELDGERSEISVSDGSFDVRVANNLVQSIEGLTAIHVRGDAQQMNNVLVGGTPGPDGPNYRVADAGFVNPSLDPAADFRLNPASPVFDLGIEGTERSDDPVGAG